MLETKSGLVTTVGTATDLKGLSELAKRSALGSLALDQRDSELNELVADLRGCDTCGRLVVPRCLLLKHLRKQISGTLGPIKYVQ